MSPLVYLPRPAAMPPRRVYACACGLAFRIDPRFPVTDYQRHQRTKAHTAWREEWVDKPLAEGAVAPQDRAHDKT